MEIGLIGLGTTDKPMAKNLPKAGYDLTVSDLNQTSVNEIVAIGTKTTTNAKIGGTCDVAPTMVPNSSQVRAVMLGKDSVIAYMKPGSMLVDMSSIDPVASKEITAELAKRDIEMLDALVSGDESKAVDGTLSFMVDDRQEILDQYKELLGAMGASAVYYGDVGAGNTTELASRIVVACSIQVLSEVLTPARMADVDPELVFQAIRGSLAGFTVMDAGASIMIEGSDKPDFKIDLYIKGLNSALDCAHTVGSLLSMTAVVQEISQWLHSNGCGQDDHSSITKCYKKLTGIKSL